MVREAVGEDARAHTSAFMLCTVLSTSKDQGGYPCSQEPLLGGHLSMGPDVVAQKPWGLFLAYYQLAGQSLDKHFWVLMFSPERRALLGTVLSFCDPRHHEAPL